MRVVFDTNVVLSGLVFGRKPQMVLQSAFSGGCDLIVSEPILRELKRKLSGKFGWHDAEIDRAVEVIRRNALTVKPNLVVTDCIDPKDNMFLEAAVEGRADCIVSGDKHLLRMKVFRGIDILTVSQFLDRIGSTLSGG